MGQHSITQISCSVALVPTIWSWGLECRHLEERAWSGELTVCGWVQCGQETSLAQQESLRLDPRTKQLAELVEAKWEDWGGRAANNIAWGHAVLGHGSSTIMSKVPYTLHTPFCATYFVKHDDMLALSLLLTSC